MSKNNYKVSKTNHYCCFQLLLVFLIFISLSNNSALASSREKFVEDFMGKPLGFLDGTVLSHIRDSQLNFSDFKPYSSIEAGAQAVEKGEIAGFLYDAPILHWFVTTHANFSLVKKPISDDTYCFAFPKNSPLGKKVAPIIRNFSNQGTINILSYIWLGANEEKKKLPVQDWSGANGTIKCGICLSNRPMTYRDEENTITGLEVHLILLIAKELNMKVEFLPVEPSERLECFRKYNVDMSCSVISMTPTRMRYYDCVPIMKTYPTILYWTGD